MGGLKLRPQNKYYLFLMQSYEINYCDCNRLIDIFIVGLFEAKRGLCPTIL
jgi:hypothetical protein